MRYPQDTIFKKQGTAVIVSISTDKYPMSTDMIFKREIRIQGLRIHSQSKFKDTVALTDKRMIRDGLQTLIAREYPLSKQDQAIDLSINSRDISKLIIKT